MEERRESKLLGRGRRSVEVIIRKEILREFKFMKGRMESYEIPQRRRVLKVPLDVSGDNIGAQEEDKYEVWAIKMVTLPSPLKIRGIVL